ncbi:hypothetical protein [Streptomyces tropicalis]|uniref:Lipoprotein n=1 Tax=Streptomyces tropicalis TaxID=3034234 RepID=A0ABT6A975_9ACTN|nr:hypothetical protein [Streptomyces tropicalis]MDF3301189.1 hypothetical protein [Streptomyces tropicalis]
MTSTTVRRTTLCLAAVTALTGASACTSGGSSAARDTGGAAHAVPVAALRSAMRSTDRADSARVELTTTFGTMMSMKAGGTLAWGHGLTGSLTLIYTGGTMADTMRRLGSTSMEARYLPDAYYARLGEQFARRTGGRHWLRYGYTDLAGLGGGSGAFLQDQMQNSTPNQSVKLLLASGDVRRLGRETVRGARTTHYGGTVRVADLAARGSHLPADQLARLRKQLTAAGVGSERVDIWVDDHDLLVKQTCAAQMAMGGMSQTAYYSGYGVRTSVARPPAGDTEDFKELLTKKGVLPGGSGTAS